MTQNTFTLTIETPEGTTLQPTDANNIKFNAEDGAIQVYANHISFMTSIKYSKLVVNFDETTSETFLCRNAIFNFNNKDNSAKIIAEYCQPQSSISKETAKDYLAYIQEQIDTKQDLSKVQLVYLENERFSIEKILEEE